MKDLGEEDSELVLDDYRIEGIRIDWKRSRELWKRLQRIIKEENE